jgi:CII-binding regulator of phage lambda lysogenization HflD
MASDVTREEFSQLVARVEVVEREVDGEKLVTRYILEQTRRNGDDLAAIKTRLDRVESRLDAVESRLDRLEQQVQLLDATVKDLVRNLPRIVSDAVRQVLAERGER